MKIGVNFLLRLLKFLSTLLPTILRKLSSKYTVCLNFGRGSRTPGIPCGYADGARLGDVHQLHVESALFTRLLAKYAESMHFAITKNFSFFLFLWVYGMGRPRGHPLIDATALRRMTFVTDHGWPSLKFAKFPVRPKPKPGTLASPIMGRAPWTSNIFSSSL